MDPVTVLIALVAAIGGWRFLIAVDDWFDRRNCVACRGVCDALLVEQEDVWRLCPKHRARLDRIAAMEKELLEPLPTEVKRMDDPAVDALLSAEHRIDLLFAERREQMLEMARQKRQLLEKLEGDDAVMFARMVARAREPGQAKPEYQVHRAYKQRGIDCACAKCEAEWDDTEYFEVKDGMGNVVARYKTGKVRH